MATPNESLYGNYIGRVLDGRYRIRNLIGVGGMAAVFLADDLTMGRQVAIKMLKEENHDELSLKRFYNESQAVQMFDHKNIVKIFDVSIEGKIKYFAMEYVNGITLRDYIKQQVRKAATEGRKGAVPTEITLKIAEQILSALAHAHSKNIIHRDIKPQNIIILKDFTVKVTDFGIAKLPDSNTLTMADKAIGTVFYISPEQARGEKNIDCRTDIYSFGVTLYEMLTGKLPFYNENAVSVAMLHIHKRPVPPREINENIPKGLEQIILRCMFKNPANRFQSAGYLLRYIQQIVVNRNTVFNFPTVEPNVNNVAPGGQRQQLPSNVRQLNTQRRASRSMFPVIGGVASAFIIVCIISAVVLLSKLSSAVATDDLKQITIPRLIDTWYSDELEAQLESTGYYNVQVEYVFDSNKERNIIIGQDPLPDEKCKVSEGKQMCDLTLKVCWGAETYELEEYAYKDKREVKNELVNSYGLKVVEREEENDYIPAGHVIRTEPAAGTVLKVGEVVTLVVSAGQDVDECVVPDYRGKSEGDVNAALKADGFELGKVTREYSSTVKAGCIISQIPNYVEGKENKTQKGTKFSFVISLGPKPAETTRDTEKSNVDRGNVDINDIW